MDVKKIKIEAEQRDRSWNLEDGTSGERDGRW